MPLAVKESKFAALPKMCYGFEFVFHSAPTKPFTISALLACALPGRCQRCLNSASYGVSLLVNVLDGQF